MRLAIGILAAVALASAHPAAGHQGAPGHVVRASMEAEILRAGSVTLHGIAFEAGQKTTRALPSRSSPKGERRLAGSEAVLRDILALLQSHDEWRFEVQGHTDSAGGRAASQARSDREARSVVSWLIGHGVPKERLVATGYGDTRPIADNATGDGRAKNQRIVLRKLNEE